jgi:hypothetical protein
LLLVPCRTSVARKEPAASVPKDTPRPSNDAPATRFANEPKPESAKSLPMPLRSKSPLNRSAGPIALLSTPRLVASEPAPSAIVPKSSVQVLPSCVSVPAPLFVSDTCAKLLTWPRKATVAVPSARSARSASWLANVAVAVPAKTPAFAVLRPTRRLLASVAPAPSPTSVPLALNPADAVPSEACSVSFAAETGAELVTDTARSATASPRWTMPKSTIVVFDWAAAGVYTRPARATVWPGNPRSAAPVVPAPLETKFTPAVPLKTPATPVLRPTPSALLVAPAARPVIEPDPVNPALTAPNVALSRSVNASGEALATVSAATGAASPTRAAKVSEGGVSVGLASR